MRNSHNRDIVFANLLLWIARLSGIAAIIPLMLIVFGESGSGPSGIREWVYLALFPFGFSAGYLFGWYRPVAGGSISLSCMVASLIVIGRIFPLEAYLIWAILSVPGVLFVLAGMKLRSASILTRVYGL